MKKHRIILRIVIGHCRLNYHLRKFGIFADNFCKSSEESVRIFILVLGRFPALVQNKLRHLGEDLIKGARLKHLEVENVLKSLSVITFIEML